MSGLVHESLVVKRWIWNSEQTPCYNAADRVGTSFPLSGDELCQQNDVLPWLPDPAGNKFCPSHTCRLRGI